MQTVIRAALAASAALIAAPAMAQDCGRACLEGVLEAYLSAMVANDPDAAPFAPDVRYTENGQAIDLGYGLWAGADAIRPYRVIAADPQAGQQAGQVAAFAVAEEHSAPVLYAVRLAVAGGAITEVEQIAVRQSGLFTPDNLVTPRPALSAPLAPGEGAARDEMIAIVDLYFEGLERNTGAIVPFGPGCERIENGTVTSNPPQGVARTQGDGTKVCTDQFNSGAFTFISRIEPRRYTVIDEERGLVFGTFMFNHEGVETSYVGPDGQRREMGAASTRPQSVIVFELFRVKDRMIDEIEAVMIGLPYGTDSGWE